MSKGRKRLGFLEYALRRKTPARLLVDGLMKEHMQGLRGRVVELGALGDGRKALAPFASPYVLTNLDGTGVEFLDAMDMKYADESVDAFICESLIEHLPEPMKAVEEILRTLKPGGTLILVAPWMYPFHGAPDDYRRFSMSMLERMLSEFRFVTMSPVGKFGDVMSTFVQLFVLPWKHISNVEKVKRVLLGAPLLVNGYLAHFFASWGSGSDETLSLVNFVVAEKRSPGRQVR